MYVNECKIYVKGANNQSQCPNFTYMTWKAMLAMGVALVLIVSWTVMHDQAAPPVYDKAKEAILMRAIGHEVLLQAGDTRSRILPVQETGPHEYLLHFESPFTFVPDSLVQAIGRVVKAQHLPPAYLVEVLTCAHNEVIFGYAIHQDSANNIVPCIGREQVKDCYKIRLRFPGNDERTASWYLLGGSLAAIGVSLLLRKLYHQRRRPSLPPAPATEATAEETLPSSPAIAIGQYRFYPDKQQLLWQEQVISLTAKETKLLMVFVATPNEVIDRNQLLKEVWEDEGVIVGRSLDMFVSKLRKKLQQDPAVSLLNVHGKGYKLAIDNRERESSMA